MIEILQFLFATAKDQNLYFNQETLIKELLVEHEFSPDEVNSVIDWFAPIINRSKFLDINPHAIRSISDYEEKYLPKIIIEQIREWESSKLITISDREILLDRLLELGVSWHLETDDMQEIMDGLIYHIQHYKHSIIPQEAQAKNPYFWVANCTIH